MASIASLLQGGGAGVPGVVQYNSPQNIPSSILQGSSPKLQGSSPILQGSSPNLQITANPNILNKNANITVPKAPNTTPQTTQPPAVTAPANPNNTTATTTFLPDKSLDIAQNLAGVDTIGTQLGNKLSGFQKSLATLLGQYGNESDEFNSSINANSNSNKNNLLTGEQTALEHASQGRQGLYGVLAQLGALNGSGLTLANSAVQNGANEDIAGATDTYGANDAALQDALKKFTSADASRKTIAQGDETDAERTANAEADAAKQANYKAISQDYSDEGDKANAQKYSDLLTSLFPNIAANTGGSGGVPTYQPLSYSAPNLSNYLGGGTRVASTPGTPSTGLSGLPGLQAYIAPTKKQTTA